MWRDEQEMELEKNGNLQLCLVSMTELMRLALLQELALVLDWLVLVAI